MYTVLNESEIPISLDVAKQHLRVGDSNHDDNIIKLKLEAAIDIAERYINGYIIGRTLEIKTTLATCIGVPDFGEVVRIEYLDTEENRKVMPRDCWDEVSHSFSTHIFLKQKPEDVSATNNSACWLVVDVGYSEVDIPRGIVVAVLLILGTLYENESDEVIGRAVNQLSTTAKSILNHYRRTP